MGKVLSIRSLLGQLPTLHVLLSNAGQVLPQLLNWYHKESCNLAVGVRDGRKRAGFCLAPDNLGGSVVSRRSIAVHDCTQAKKKLGSLTESLLLLQSLGSGAGLKCGERVSRNVAAHVT